MVKTILYKRTIALGTSKPIDFRACALLKLSPSDVIF